MIQSRTIETARLRTHYLDSGPEDGVPVVLVHGNLATARFFEHLMPGAPDRYRLIAPDMRGFGDSEPAPIDATRGLRDWADDTHALVEALGIERPVHLAGWSTGGAAVALYAIDRPVASLTLIDPVSPYGFGGAHTPDFAGTGGGAVNPEFVRRLAAGDRSPEPGGPRSTMTGSYWSPDHREPPEREEMLLDELLKSVVGDDHYPGDSTPSEHWPRVAPGTRGILNALSPRYCDWTGILDVDPQPPILWTHGSEDIVIADGSAWEMGTLGQLGAIPGWPGEEVFPPQQMVTEIAAVLDRYGGRVVRERFEGSGHFPPIDAAERWSRVFFGFLDDC
ncbi:MAG TPA: alpha/beta hydrolase [Solirubrobacteraceae bacterium]|nr:alpha/beta hydrolase [Solirubrobacteraceae bacterium]